MTTSICTNCKNSESCTLPKQCLIYDCSEFSDHEGELSFSQSLADLRFLVISGSEAKDHQLAVMR